MARSYEAVNRMLSEHGDSGSRLRVRTFSTTPENSEPIETFVMLEGDKAGLAFLARLILAHLETDVCNLSLHPAGAGSLHFTTDSNTGIYLHRLPCDHALGAADHQTAESPPTRP
jgi:hypothetical protein